MTKSCRKLLPSSWVKAYVDITRKLRHFQPQSKSYPRTVALTPKTQTPTNRLELTPF